MTRAYAILLTVTVAACNAVSQAPPPEATGESRVEWKTHEMDRPHPSVVSPTTLLVGAPPPPNALVLFDGTDLSEWITPQGAEPGWAVRDGYFEVVPGTGTLRSRHSFGDVQLHIEFASPTPPTGSGQNRGNSGVIFIGHYELQVLD
jgi:hypothetical protein